MNLLEALDRAPENNKEINESIVITHDKLSRYKKILCTISGGSDSDIVLDLCEHGRYAPVADYLTDGMRNLDAAGCDIISMAGVTPHIVFPEVEAHTNKEMVSMVDTACEAAAADGSAGRL